MSHSKGIIQNPLSRKWRISIALLLAFLVVGVSWFFGDWRHNNAEQKVGVVQTKPARPEDMAWQLCWRMPPSAKSSLGIREKCSPAKIVRLDEAYFTVVASYEHQWKKYQAVLNWEKAKDPEKGYWSQPTPKLSGTWALTRISPDLYNGWYRDSKGGEDGVMWLQAIK